MTDILKAACLQFTAAFDIDVNLKKMESMIRAAASQEAALIATPENTDRLGGDPALKLALAFTQDDHPMIALAERLANELKIIISLGSVSIKLPHEKLVNRSLLFSPQGKILASYDKIHLFDVDLPNGDKYRESDLFDAGERLSTAAIDDITFGLTVCYDVRFSYLYRALAKKGADIITVPAAFTVPTGEAHWEVLLRARAIETGSFILAAAQTGEHEGGRKTWGHSMIIDPWGKVLAQAGFEEEIIIADLILADVIKARNSIPALRHDREFS